MTESALDATTILIASWFLGLIFGFFWRLVSGRR